MVGTGAGAPAVVPLALVEAKVGDDADGAIQATRPLCLPSVAPCRPMNRATVMLVAAGVTAPLRTPWSKIGIRFAATVPGFCLRCFIASPVGQSRGRQGHRLAGDD